VRQAIVSLHVSTGGALGCKYVTACQDSGYTDQWITLREGRSIPLAYDCTQAQAFRAVAVAFDCRWLVAHILPGLTDSEDPNNRKLPDVAVSSFLSNPHMRGVGSHGSENAFHAHGVQDTQLEGALCLWAMGDRGLRGAHDNGNAMIETASQDQTGNQCITNNAPIRSLAWNCCASSIVTALKELCQRTLLLPEEAATCSTMVMQMLAALQELLCSCLAAMRALWGVQATVA
jgi:hypothetical protein